MKKQHNQTISWSVAIIFSLAAGFSATGDNTPTQSKLDLTNSGQIPADSGYQVVQRAANSQVWEYTTMEPASSEIREPRKHRYTELATGLNHLENGRWTASRAAIEILPDGRAAARHGQHQSYFPADIYQGRVETVTADGRHLKSQPLGLSYADGSNTVLIAELKDSTGVVTGPNQVIYPDAFTGVKADLRYTYTIAGFEQDIILREQPPRPEALGLNPESTRLQMLTEFTGTEEPVAAARFADANIGLTDHQLAFGSMKMIQGRAFSLAGSTATAQLPDVPVFKSWHHQGGRTYLVEEVSLKQINAEIGRLPAAALSSPVALGKDPALDKVAATRWLPSIHGMTSGGQSFRLARAGLADQRGYVLDYLLINYSPVDIGYTFRSDTTYLISNAYFTDNGTDVIEGGTVIKFDATTANNNPSLNLDGSVFSCLTGPYRPAIFTTKDDNSVGETIPGSTGNPAGSYGGTWNSVNFNYYNENLVLHDIRMSGLAVALNLSVNSAQLDNVQFVNCGTAVNLRWDNLNINNALFDNVGQAVGVSGGNPSFTGTFITSHNCGVLAGGGLQQVSLTDCLLVNTTNITGSAGTALVTNNVAVVASDAGVFQTVGAGAHYLANGSPFRNAGTASVNATVLGWMAARTTYPPVICSNLTFSAPTNFTIQAPRNGGVPDLGYHYDPLDYITDGLQVNNTSLGITNGVATACYNRPGITLENGGSLVSTGTPVLPNWFVRYQSVQEQAVSLGGANPQFGQNVSAVWSAASPSSGSFSFSHFSAPENGGTHFKSTGASAYGSLTLQNSELWGGTNDFSGASPASTTLIKNNLFYRTTFFAASGSPQTVLACSNNLFLQSAISLQQPGSGAWAFFDNALDTSTIAPQSQINSGYNGYINCPFTLPGAGNVILTNVLAYQAGPLGNYYQPAGSPLADAGGITADQAGFYHFTTRTSEAKETNSLLDIGYHYVAVDGGGNPMDNNQDGIPDYLEDANGDGMTDGGELPWTALPAFTLQPTNQVLYPGGNLVFNTAFTGQAVNLQWYCNNLALPGQTNTTLVLNNVQPANAGVYFLVATNYSGSVASSNAVLAPLAAPAILTQPASQTVLQTDSTTLGVAAGGLFMNYQWYSNSVPVAGATNASLTVYTCATNAPADYYVVVANSAGAVTSSNAVITIQAITSQPVIYAKSGAYADVSNAVASAVTGDVVLIPPGTYVWSQPLTLYGVSLRGSGTNQTIILDNVTPNINNGTMINMSGSTNGLTEISNFQLAPDPVNATPSYAGIIVAAGSASTPWRIDHMFFNGLYSKNIAAYGNAMSLVDHNLFLVTTISVWTGNYGDQYASYSLPATYGLSSSNSLYIEDNYFTNIVGIPRQVCDGCGGARSVFRYNTVWNDNCGNHGTETGGNVRSQRSMEIYGNTFNYTPGIGNPGNAYFCVCMLRGGSCVMYSNTANGYVCLLGLRNFRNTDTFSGAYYPYNGANGANPWDSNNPAILLQGAHTGPSGVNYLQVAGAGWTVNQWVGDTLLNTNNGLFSEVTTNSADTMYFVGLGVVHNTILYFNAGDGFVLRQVYAAIDQPGRGSGDLLQENGYDASGNLIVINTTTGTASWPHQVLEPMYFWANTINGQPAAAGSPYPTLQEGRDYYNETPKPGYTPFPYPHPLTLMGVH